MLPEDFATPVNMLKLVELFNIDMIIIWLLERESILFVFMCVKAIFAELVVVYQ